MFAAVTEKVTEKYASFTESKYPYAFSQAFNPLNESFEALARFADSLNYAMKAVEYIGDFKDGIRASKIGDIFAKMGAGLAATRAFISLLEALSGRMFRAWDNKSNTWKVDGKYDEETGTFSHGEARILWKERPIILARLCIFAGRSIGFFFKVADAMHDTFDLGKHAKGLNQALSGLWCVVVATYAACSVYFISEAIKEWKADKNDKTWWEVKYAISTFSVCLMDIINSLVMSGAIADIFKESSDVGFCIAMTIFVAVSSFLYCLHELIFEVPRSPDTGSPNYMAYEELRKNYTSDVRV